jgi:hypothetical protein
MVGCIFQKMIIADTEGVLKLGETIGCNQNVLDDLKKDM